MPKHWEGIVATSYFTYYAEGPDFVGRLLLHPAG